MAEAADWLDRYEVGKKPSAPISGAPGIEVVHPKEDDSWLDQFALEHYKNKPEDTAKTVGWSKKLQEQIEKIPGIGRHIAPYADVKMGSFDPKQYGDYENKTGFMDKLGFKPPTGFLTNMNESAADPNNHLIRDTMGSLATQAATGPAMLPAMAGQAAYGGGSSLYDSIKEKGITNLGADDAKKAVLRSLIYGGGPIAAKALSPALEAVPRVAPGTVRSLKIALNKPGKLGIGTTPEMEALMRSGQRQAEEQAITKKVPDWLGKLSEGAQKHIGTAAYSTAIGHFLGHPVEGFLAGAALPHLKDFASKAVPAWYHGTARLPLPNVANIASGAGPAMSRVPMAEIAHNPTTQAILNAIARQNADFVEKTYEGGVR